ncbi:hypothetical protein AWC38_SpisGene12258 [Stylophora pistillata]|uniref:Uncharacterized protein n=1 Tax=Stylophora pistillata TaxID=50429 RepID=A0A2B4S335_STYPI|nr:hypothetical protein AWC38_SpisGene12258 [Stylophora pistillata]
MPSAECHTDHRLVPCKVKLQFKSKPKKIGIPVKKLNVSSLCREEVKAKFQADLQLKLDELPQAVDPTPDTLWEKLKSAILKTSQEVFGHSKKKNQDWFDENEMEIQDLLAKKRTSHQAHLAQPTCPVKRANFRCAFSALQRRLRGIKNDWLDHLAMKTQLSADAGDYRGFYEALKAVYGPTHQVQSPLRSSDGQVLLTDNTSILARCSENFQTLLSANRTVQASTTDCVPQLSLKEELDEPPTLNELSVVINQLKSRKAAGVDGIPPEIRRNGMVIQLHENQRGQARLNGDLSEPFPMSNGVKQGCVLGPTLLSIFFSMMLKQATMDLDVNEGVYIRYRLDGSLFSLRRLRAHTKTQERLIRDLLFADDAALVAHTERALQRITSCFAGSSQLYGPEVSLKETEVPHQPAPLVEYRPPRISIGDADLKSIKQFTYLGCTISSDAKMDKEIDNRLAKKNSSFGRLIQTSLEQQEPEKQNKDPRLQGCRSHHPSLRL